MKIKGRETMRVIAIVLIVLGILALGYQGFTYVSRDTIVDAGPVQVQADREHYVWIPPVVGVAAVVVGGLMLVMGGRRSGAV
jgi:hypothetical protein